MTVLELDTPTDGYFTGDPPIRMTKYVPHVPWPKQHACLALDHKTELLFGGAAGPGKSDLLLMGALQYVDIPGYAAILFRRQYTDLSLPGAIMSRAIEWLKPTDATWDSNDKQFTFPSGATLNFAYLKTEDDKYRYQSAEFQYIGFDELTQFTESQYLYLFSRLRRLATSDVPLRMRSATNPGGKNHAWVKDRWNIEMVEDPERRPLGTAPTVDGGVFIPGKLEDNPALDIPTYEQMLAALDPYEAALLRHGDWDARPPGDWFFEHDDLAAAVALGKEMDRLLNTGDLVPQGGGTELCIDWGENTHGLNLIPLPDGGVHVAPGEVAVYGREAGEVSKLMLASASRFGFPITVAHYDAAGVQSMRTFVKTARANGYPGLKSVKVPFGAVATRSTGKSFKAQAAGYLRRLFIRVGRGETRQVVSISPTCTKLLNQLPWLERDPENETVWLKDEGQHGPDALVAGTARRAVQFADAVVKEAQAA